ncbi:MAG TPA: hypothetical protein VLG69_01580 [Candidatus Andersenbacteria bacterium]|nr:hypothetical protein [Candidatus Andersenbacteria bacterium]
MKEIEILGIDIGGVITAGGNEMFTDNFLEVQAMPDCFEVIQRLVTERFGERVYLVSKCGMRMQQKSVEWLCHHNFFDLTGVKSDHVEFCQHRSGKAPICDRLGITHFIDDRLEVLGYLTSVSNIYLFRPKPSEVNRFSHHLPKVRQMNSWRDILKELVA